MIDKLDLLSKDELKELVRIYARNIYALDGVWFQSVEGKNGMDEAMSVSYTHLTLPTNSRV